MKDTFLWSLFAILIVFISVFFFVRNSYTVLEPQVPNIENNIETKPQITQVNIGGKNVQVELAVTSAEQAQGLSGRASLHENTGMLFIFNESGKYPFWMKDMNFPIDMIWIGEDSRIVFIKKDARPELYPETYGPGATDKDAKYVLEVADGFTDKNNIKVGDPVLFTY